MTDPERTKVKSTDGETAKKATKGGGGDNKGGGGDKKAGKDGMKNKNDAKVLIGITCTKEENFAQWYTEVITKAELIEYYDVSGCYILRPWVYSVWECVQDFMNRIYRTKGLKNSYFPMFVTKSKLEAEQDHVEGFSAEVAWVTKSGSSNLTEPIAIRPTSETIMYPAFSKWIRSHRDLPLKLNQWCPVVRWEFSNPTPFIRTREFLWQEGHTAHETAEEARQFAQDMLMVYKRVYEELYAIHVIPGVKSELEKFAGGHSTYTVEAFVECNGRSIQAATSHYLADNFARMFHIQYEDLSREKHFAQQTSFGLSTRSIGAMIMIHGDDKGLVLPPRVAPVQVVIVPIVTKTCDQEALKKCARALCSFLCAHDILAECDDRDCYNPGWKYNHWELKGVPIRLELGPRDMEQNTCRLVRRVDAQKMDLSRAEPSIAEQVKNQLQEIHAIMLEKSRQRTNAHILRISTFDEVMPALNQKKLVLAPWCQQGDCEEKVKKLTAQHTLDSPATTGLSGSMKTLCVPLAESGLQPELPAHAKCFHCERPALVYCLWGRSY